MSNSVTLSAAMRNNLLSLQNTAQLLATTQGRLATGKKVNSALDNPNSFFAAQSLTNTATDLSNLLDGMGQAIQTITAATQGITAAESIITQMQAVANSAAQSVSSSNATSNVTLPTFATQGTASAVSHALGTTSFAKVALVALDTTALGTSSLNVQNGDSLTVSVGTTGTYTFTVGASAGPGGAANGGGSTLADLNNWLQGLDSGNLSISANTGLMSVTNNDASNGITISGALASELFLTGTYGAGSGATAKMISIDFTDYTALAAANTSTMVQDLTNSSGLVMAGANNGNYLNPASTLTFTMNGTTTTVNVGSTETLGTLISQINTVSGLSASYTSAGLVVTNNNSVTVTIGGSAAGLITTGGGTIAANSSSTAVVMDSGFGAAATQHMSNLTPAAGQTRFTGAANTLYVTLGTTTTAVTFAATDTVATFLTNLNNVSGVSASYNSSTGALSVTATNGSALSFSGTPASILGLTNASASSANVGASYTSQYDTLRSQLNMLVQDSSYQGINLIAGTAATPLKVQFNNNATNPNQLVINAVDLTTTGLALTAATGNWNTSAAINSSISSLTTANTTLRNQSANLGTNLTTVQTRQQFTTNLINTLQTGAGSLTNADMNQESANMLALQTAQQLGVSSLSLASQANQSVLKLFP